MTELYRITYKDITDSKGGWWPFREHLIFLTGSLDSVLYVEVGYV